MQEQREKEKKRLRNSKEKVFRKQKKDERKDGKKVILQGNVVLENNNKMAIINYNNNRNNGSNVNFIDSFDNALHPPLYCRICDVLMMFMLTGKFANKYFCGMCGLTEDPEESEFYAKHKDELRSLDDDSGISNVSGVGKYRYEEMIVQSKGDYSSSFSQASERQPQMTRERQKRQSSTSTHRVSQEDNNDWASIELKRDLEANGIRQVVRIMDIDNNANTTTGNEGAYHSSRINRIERPR